MLNSIIIDDEPYSSESLQMLLEKYCPDINTIKIFSDPRLAIPEISLLRPQLLFLDIQMPHVNGFELLQKIPDPQFEVIFTTSHDEYAINAIRFSALDYLLKPIDPSELIRAVDRAKNKISSPPNHQLEILLQKLQNKSPHDQRIVLPTQDGYEVIPVRSIITCEARSNYTALLLENKKTLVISRTLKDIEEMLQEYSFMRVHNSYLVNLNAVKRYLKGDNGQLVMKDDSLVEVSRRRKDEVLERLQGMR